MSNSEAKLIPVRVALDNISSVKKGWFFRFAKEHMSDEFDKTGLNLLAEYKMNINWVDSLGDINYTRINNISLGAELINGLILKPSQVFSLRKCLGNATEKRGFGAGPVIKNGITTTTVGGGLCLVSSIVFNVALLSDMTILEKYNHGTDLWGEDRFVGLGLDATYAYGILDLKFSNTRKSDVIIRIGVNKEKRYLWCEMWSKDSVTEDIRIESDVLEELLPENNTEHKAFQKGWKVRTRRYSGERVTYDQVEVYRPFYK